MKIARFYVSYNVVNLNSKSFAQKLPAPSGGKLDGVAQNFEHTSLIYACVHHLIYKLKYLRALDANDISRKLSTDQTAVFSHFTSLYLSYMGPNTLQNYLAAFLLRHFAGVYNTL